MPLVLLLTLCLAIQTQAPRDKPAPAAATAGGVIEGRVIVQDSKPAVPVRRARVSLGGDRLKQPELTDTDTDGRYRFAQLPSGTYRITVSKPGFVTLEAGATQAGQRPPAIELKDAGTVTANVALPRGASIEGRVQNDAGEPLEGVIVSAVRFRPSTVGLGRILIRETRTDDLGRYRLHTLAPGTYFVEATPDPRRGDEGAFATGERPPGIARTFFPGTAQVHDARQITLARAQDASGTDFAVLHIPTVRLGGKVVDSTGKPVPASLRLRPVSGLPLSIGGGILPDGQFQFSSVPPGEYWLMASHLTAADRVTEFAAMRLSLGGQDQMDLSLTLAPGAVVQGRVETDGSPVPSLRGTQVETVPLDLDFPPARRPAPAPAVVSADGNFRINGTSGRQLLRLGPLPTGWALKNVSLDGKDVTDSGSDMLAGPQPLNVTIVLTDKTATLEGTVVDGEASVAAYRIVLFPDDERRWGEHSRFVKVAPPRADRTFILDGVLPGKYFVAAVSVLDDGEWHDPDVLRRLRAAATVVMAAASGTVKVTPKLQVIR